MGNASTQPTTSLAIMLAAAARSLEPPRPLPPLPMLTTAAAAAAAANLAGSAAPRRAPAVPLSCLESDFFGHSRLFLPPPR